MGYKAWFVVLISVQAVFPLVAMVALGWFLFIIGFGLETTDPQPG